MLRTLGVITALQLLTWTPVLACTGQVGATIFQDNFADDTGGWDETPPYSSVQPRTYVFALDATSTEYWALDLTFNATDGDYCMDVVLPPAIAANNQMYAELVFWAAVNYSSMMQVSLSSAGTVYLEKRVSQQFTTVASVQNAPGFNSAANAVNSLRVTVLSGTITIYLNGQTVKSIRAQEPTGVMFFGMGASDDTAVANAPQVKVQGFSVTAGK